MGIGLVALPFIVWLMTSSGIGVLAAVALLVLIGLKFLPTALAAFKNRGVSALGVDRWQRDKGKSS
jgi:hypothetical protein